MRSISRNLCALVLAGLAAGCAQPSRTTAMVATAPAGAALPDDSVLKENVQVAQIAGGKETDPLWASQVSGDAFRQALTQSLRQRSILGDQSAPLSLNARLVSLDQPVIGFDMTVTSTVFYEITNAAGERVFEKTVVAPFTATFSDSPLGVERLRMANEGSIRTNIQRFIDQLIKDSRVNPGAFGPALTSSVRLGRWISAGQG